MKLVCFDCDSTLSGIEGIDELGRGCEPRVFAQIEAMTRDAMDGRIAVEAVFAKRLELIRPSRSAVEAVGKKYLATVEPTAEAALSALTLAGWTPAIISGGFTAAIQPLAEHLGVEIVEAVPLLFGEDGEYLDFGRAFPAARSGGKAEVVRQLKHRLAPTRVVMVGDGVSDLEAKPEVDLFVGFGRYAVRERVKREADAFITSLADLPDVIRQRVRPD